MKSGLETELQLLSLGCFPFTRESQEGMMSGAQAHLKRIMADL